MTIVFNNFSDGGLSLPTKSEGRVSRPPNPLLDELQVCAQALCLEEMTGKTITTGYVYYAQTHQRKLVEISEQLRKETIATIADVIRILETGAMPQASYSPRCKGCSLNSHCLPKASDKVTRYQEEN